MNCIKTLNLSESLAFIRTGEKMQNVTGKVFNGVQPPARQEPERLMANGQKPKAKG
jgi:hypothetical protein